MATLAQSAGNVEGSTVNEPASKKHRGSKEGECTPTEETISSQENEGKEASPMDLEGFEDDCNISDDSVGRAHIDAKPLPPCAWRLLKCSREVAMRKIKESNPEPEHYQETASVNGCTIRIDHYVIQSTRRDTPIEQYLLAKQWMKKESFSIRYAYLMVLSVDMYPSSCMLVSNGRCSDCMDKLADVLDWKFVCSVAPSIVRGIKSESTFHLFGNLTQKMSSYRLDQDSLCADYLTVPKNFTSQFQEKTPLQGIQDNEMDVKWEDVRVTCDYVGCYIKIFKTMSVTIVTQVALKLVKLAHDLDGAVQKHWVGGTVLKDKKTTDELDGQLQQYENVDIILDHCKSTAFRTSEFKKLCVRHTQQAKGERVHQLINNCTAADVLSLLVSDCQERSQSYRQEKNKLWLNTLRYSKLSFSKSENYAVHKCLYATIAHNDTLYGLSNGKWYAFTDGVVNHSRNLVLEWLARDEIKEGDEGYLDEVWQPEKKKVGFTSAQLPSQLANFADRLTASEYGIEDLQKNYWVYSSEGEPTLYQAHSEYAVQIKNIKSIFLSHDEVVVNYSQKHQLKIKPALIKRFCLSGQALTSDAVKCHLNLKEAEISETQQNEIADKVINTYLKINFPAIFCDDAGSFYVLLPELLIKKLHIHESTKQFLIRKLHCLVAYGDEPSYNQRYSTKPGYIVCDGVIPDNLKAEFCDIVKVPLQKTDTYTFIYHVKNGIGKEVRDLASQCLTSTELLQNKKEEFLEGVEKKLNNVQSLYMRHTKVKFEEMRKGMSFLWPRVYVLAVMIPSGRSLHSLLSCRDNGSLAAVFGLMWLIRDMKAMQCPLKVCQIKACCTSEAGEFGEQRHEPSEAHESPNLEGCLGKLHIRN